MRIPQDTPRKTEFEHALEKKSFLSWVFSSEEPKQTSQARAKRLLSAAIRGELTDRQRPYMSAYYSGEKMPTIARKNGVNVSTVSRTIRRAHSRLRRVLKYCGPELLEYCVSMPTERRKAGNAS